MSLMKCPECNKKISSKSSACVFCGMQAPWQSIPEETIATYKYRMTAAAPLWFTIFCGLVFFYGIGLLLLLFWFILKTPAPTLTITNKAVIYRTPGEKRIEITEIDRVTACASWPQSSFNNGYVVIYQKSLLSLPMIINGLPDPNKIEQIILDQKANLP